MATKNNISGLFNSVRESQRARKKRIEEAFNKAVKSGSKIMVGEYRDIISDIFKEAVNNFYEYHQRYYKRTNSLYNILEFNEDDGRASVEYTLNESKMTTTRGGGSLYEQVFVEGWHGGAKKGNVTRFKSGKRAGMTIRTPHPDPGTPYWRKPRDSYTYWFSKEDGPAARTTPSPYDMFTTNVEAKHGYVQERWTEIMQREFNKQIESMR